MEECWIGFGGNQGDVPARYLAVLAFLQQHSDIREVRASSLYRSAAMGAVAGDTFWNGVVAVRTALPPLELLDQLQVLEQHHQRVRDVRWGPRTLDLDLLGYGSHSIAAPRLTVPHPGAWYRRFVLDPWHDLAPDWRHPVYQLTIAELRQRLVSSPPRLWLAGRWEPTFLASLQSLIAARWPDLICEPLVANALPESGLLITNELSPNLPTYWPHLVLPNSGSDGDHQQFVIDVLTAAYMPPVRVTNFSTGDSESTTAEDAVDEPHAEE